MLYSTCVARGYELTSLGKNMVRQIKIKKIEQYRVDFESDWLFRTMQVHGLNLKTTRKNPISNTLLSLLFPSNKIINSILRTIRMKEFHSTIELAIYF